MAEREPEAGLDEAGFAGERVFEVLAGTSRRDVFGEDATFCRGELEVGGKERGEGALSGEEVAQAGRFDEVAA